MRFLLNNLARRSVAIKSTPKATKLEKQSVTVLKSASGAENNIGNSNDNLTKSWGQRCSPSCGCVLRFETKIDERQRIVDCNYVAKSVVTTINKENGGRLMPVYTTRMNRPMFQECKCQSLHALAKNVTSFLPNKRWDHVQNMNSFTFTRSSIAFRHAVLSEHGLPRTDTNCFDIVEEAFTGMFNGNVPSKRRINAPFGKVLAAECSQRGVVEHHFKKRGNHPDDNILSIPHPCDERTERNHKIMSTSKTMGTLGMFDINAENWSDEDEYEEEDPVDSNYDNYDWVSYVDEQYMIDDSA